MNVLRKIQFIVLLVILSQVSLLAQNNNDFFIDTTQHLNISFGTHYTYGSSVMSNNFLNKFIFGGKIEREHKDNAYQNLSSNNRLGGDLNYNFNVEIPMDTFLGKTNISFQVGMEIVEHMDAEFSSDLFKFTFDGNKQFAGESIDIGKTNYNYYKYQQLNLGLIKYNYSDDKLFKEGVIFSIIMAQEHKAITITEGSIFTEELGREIDVDLNYLYNSSDTANKGAGAYNGFGVSTDLFTEVLLKNGDKVYLGLEDLGFIYWNNNSLEIAADSTFYFEGIVVDNIFDLNDSLLSNISKDSIINSISTSNKKGNYSIALPTAINLNYTKVLNEKWKINIGVYHKILSNYFPLISTNYYYYFNKKFVAKAHISYGGYGKWNTGLAFAKSVANYFDIFIGTNNIEAFIVPNSSYSSSGFIGLKAYF
ncbi:MAG: hypothetical protein COA97_00070 [Flavobacteriales bacterium]|nr:MAG: hypothetical protein COA97_00070 [Flavobacteriales bacterium]